MSWEMKTLGGGIAKVNKRYLGRGGGGHFSEVTFTEEIGYISYCLAPNPPPPAPHSVDSALCPTNHKRPAAKPVLFT